MKIDLTNKWVRQLVKDCSFDNGCDLVTGVLKNVALALAVAGGAAYTVVALVGFIMYLCSPWFGRFDVGLSLAWLGPAWWADILRSGVIIWIGLTICLTIFVLGWALSIWASAIARGTRPIASKGAVLVQFLADVAHSVGSRICPTVELIIPAECQGLTGKNIRLDSGRLYTVGDMNIANGLIHWYMLPADGIDDDIWSASLHYNLRSGKFSRPFGIVLA